VVSCPSCQRESPEGFRFCPFCGHPLTEVLEPRTERRVVTVLFCDLVGFTTHADRADPEDVRAILEPFHRLAKAQIERFGGTLDKFIGDAAMGVFGSPVAHEDDPERAVRAALAILDGLASSEDARSSSITARAGVQTGEAVVTLAPGVQVGENVAGDVVNTASRLQAAAAPGTALVGAATYQATLDAVDYQELPPVVAKGKSEPLSVWRPLAVKPLPASWDRPATSPFVGRRQELAVLEDAVRLTLAEPGVRLVSVIGGPGAGKSRLTVELRSALPRLAPGIEVTWLRGRCLPYGEGITFWALGEMVKGHAGILESDPFEERDRKLTSVLARLLSDPAEQAWLGARLAPLVGGASTGPVERDEAFAAWYRFLAAVAEQRPVVALIEDLHWADPALLSFVQFVAEQSAPVPLLIIITARPELYDRSPTFGADAETSVALTLSPLTAEETASLVTGLLGDATIPHATMALLQERAGGNPLYAEEMARVMQDRGLVGAGGESTHDLDQLGFPQTLQSVIAARLDTLSPGRRSLLQDASVVGRVFWSGAVAFVSEADQVTVAADLADLERREFVRSAPASTIQSQDEFSFWHAIVRDVAYGQIPRAARSSKHRRVAAWTEAIAGERVGDLAEILAHHAISALQLARAAGETEGIADLEDQAARYLRLAAQRALSLDVGRAEEQFLQALELTDPESPDRPRVLASLAEAAFQSGKLEEADRRFEEAIAGLREHGFEREAADAMVRRSVVLEYRGDVPAGRSLLAAAISLLEASTPGQELARALATSAGSLTVAGRYQEAIREGEKAIRLARSAGEITAEARAHGFRGFSRAIQGDLEGLEEQRSALTALRAAGLGRATAVAYNNLASCLLHLEGPRPALDLMREGVGFAETRGLRESVMALQDSMLTVLFEVGDWDELLRLSEEVIAEARRQGSGHDEVYAEADRAVVLVYRQGAQARELCESVLERARPLEDAPLVLLALLAAALARQASGDRAGTAAVLRDVLEVTAGDSIVDRASHLPELARLAVGAGDLPLAERLLAETDRLVLERYRLANSAARAVVLEASGQTEAALEAFESARHEWSRWGNVLEQAHAAWGAGRCLAALGRDMSEQRLEEAVALFDRLGARPTAAAGRSLLR
jgi:predicted ATPase/class 3 adenylate cyclase